jgi:hypothetical protein
VDILTPPLSQRRVSGGFTELSLFGRWTITRAQYVAEARC